MSLSVQWGVVTDDRSTLTFLLPFSNSDYFYAAFPTNKVNTGGINLHGVRNPTYLELYSSISNNSNTANNWQFSGRNINPCWLAVGIQQWGYAQKPTSAYDFNWVYPIPFPTLVGAIMLTPQYEGQCRPHSINSFDRFSCSLRTDGTKPELNSNHVFAIGFQQWGLASTSRAWATESKYPISFRIATFAISLIPRNPEENSIYAEQVGIKLCTKTGFYGGLQITCDTDNLFYIAIGIQRPNTTIFAVPKYPINVKN